MLDQPNSWLSPRLRGFDSRGRRGKTVVCAEPIEPGATLVVFGGSVITGEELRSGPRGRIRLTLQVDDDAFLFSEVEGPADWINHSCDPSAGLVGQIVLAAIRPMRTGEEVTFDYATADGTCYDEFQCACETASCRGRIRGDDWTRPDLQARYAGLFSPYLQQRIDRALLQQRSEPKRRRS